MDGQQRRAKQSTIEYTEARNELLELLQAYSKSSKDFDELKTEKEGRSNTLTQLKNKLENEQKNLDSDIANLKTSIFKSAEYEKILDQVHENEVLKEKLMLETKYYEAHHKMLHDMKDELSAKNKQLESDKTKLKSDLDEQKIELEQKKIDFNNKFDKQVKNMTNKDLLEAKERKNTRSVKNNELEEQWNIRKIEMRKQRDKYINESEEKKELQIQHTKLDEAYKDQAQEISN